MEDAIGSVVRSKAGRDAGQVFIVFRQEGRYVYLADGRIRRIETPKRKKMKHIECLVKESELRERIRTGSKIANAEVRKELSKYGDMIES